MNALVALVAFASCDAPLIVKLGSLKIRSRKLHDISKMTQTPIILTIIPETIISLVFK